ncbi:MAG: hypothetical protein KJ955_08165 [Nanoarchaeota archaeon]|nr:hypothetical protein [Nanoarchaeota archaeon]
MNKLGLVGTVLTLGLTGVSCDKAEQKQPALYAQETPGPYCDPVELRIATDNENSLATFSNIGEMQALFCELPTGSYELILVFPDKSGTRIEMTPSVVR